MALQGTIDTFELTEVVRLLAAGAKTGVLRLEGSRGSGRVWVKEGKVTGIEVDHAPRAGGPAEAMFELLRFDDGNFTFATGEAADPEGEPTDLEEILGDAEAQLAEWREIERVVPTTRATVTLRPELKRGDVVLDKARWRLVAAIGGGVTVATLGEAMDLGELPVSRAVKDLIELGVVDLDASAVDEAEPVVVDDPVVEPEPVVDLAPEASVEFEGVDDEDPVVIGTEPVLSEAPADSAARSTLDEFAAGFGLADPVPASAEPISMMDAPPLDGAPVGDDGFASFDLGPVGGDESANGFDPLGDFSLGGDDPFAASGPPPAEPGPSGFEEASSPFLGASNDAAEVARQLSNLSPAAARAVAAAAKATTDEEREAALAAVAQEGEEPIDRELLLRFLASVKS